ncbi:MAG: AAA family ATPase [Pirellulales bacterium]|nr:AAA family ATPase [Pirellulales bacterium]
MRSIAVMNQKGGVGKTTTAVNLSAALADMGHRVCLVDLDPQAHATLHLGVEPRDDEPSIYHLLTQDTSAGETCRQVAENLWLIPSSLDLAAAEVELIEGRNRDTDPACARPGILDPSSFFILRDKLLADPPPVDYLLVDCPPSLGILTLGALGAVGEVLIPLQPHFFALHGLSKLLETIRLAASRLNVNLKLGGVVLCMYDGGTRLAAEVGRDVEEFLQNARGQSTPWADAEIFQTRVRRNIRLAEAPSFGQSILQYAPDSNGAKDYKSLAAEVARQDRATASVSGNSSI